MPRTHAALIVDSDPKGLESLVYGFQGAGWRVTACPAPETASLLVRASGAEIVVIASRADAEKALTLVRQLRGRDVFRTLPILLLGPEELRASAKQHADVDLLPLPAFVRDVLSASQMLVGSGSGERAVEEPCFESPVTAQGSLSLVRATNGMRRSGSLHLARKGRHGEILFFEGELTAAQVGQLQGMAALQHMLAWNEGSLELRLRAVVRRRQLHQNAQEFLEEFDRFQRDYDHAMKDVGPGSTVYVVNQERLRISTGAFPAEVTPVVRLCDGERTLSDVIDESPFRVLDTVRILSRLVELAVVSRREPKPAESLEEQSPLDAFWATARITMDGQDRCVSRPSRPIPIAAPPAATANEDAGAKRTQTPIGTKPRASRQTQELGKPSSTSSSSSESRESLAESPAKRAEIDAGRARSEATTKRVDTARLLTPSMGVSSLPARSSPAAGVPVVRAPASAQTSGSFELRKTARTPQQAVQRESRRSVVIDTALVNAVDVSPSKPEPSVERTAPASAEGPSAAAIRSAVAADSTVPSPPETVDRWATVATPPPAPIRLPTPAPSPSAVSPEAQPTPSTAAPLPEVKRESSGIRVTGEMQVVPSARSSRAHAKVGTTSSFQIDPSLVAEAPTTAPPQSAPPLVPEPAPAPASRQIHRPSGSFSAVESDFFEREADLYKVDKSESFADLDDAKSGPHGKRPANGPSRKK